MALYGACNQRIDVGLLEGYRAAGASNSFEGRFADFNRLSHDIRKDDGWYTGRPGPNTRRLVVQTGGFLYDSDAYNEHLPDWTQVGGRAHLVVPHSVDNNDSRLQRGDFTNGEDFFRHCRDAFN